MLCPICGAAELLRDTRDIPYSYKGRTTLIRAVTGDYCQACGECITDPDESRASMNQMLAFNKQVDSCLRISGDGGERDR